MKQLFIALFSLSCLSGALVADQPATTTPMMDCSSMTAAEQQFAAQLSAANKAMFCGQFTADQRASAMQMTSQPDASGNAVTADQAVQSVAGPAQPAKTTSGCPVK